MPEVESQNAPQVPGWIAGLPDDLKANEEFATYKTVGDLAKTYLDTKTKTSDLEKKLGNSIPKLADDANDEQRGQYFDALGRPKQPSEYEFEGEDKNAPEWSESWKKEFHSLGLTKAQGKDLSSKFNARIQAMVEAHNTSLKNEYTTAETTLKSEWGDKYDTNVELAKRVYQKLNLSEFDKDFASGTDMTRLSTIRLLMKVAVATGEDKSPQGGQGKTGAYTENPYPNTKMPPARQ